MPNELTVEELVKAMRLCAEKTKNGETCVTGQKDCPFGVTVMDCTERMNLATADALESLAAERDAYRDKLKAALAENTRLAEKVSRAQQTNEPLTVDELRQMIGSPIWISGLNRYGILGRKGIDADDDGKPIYRYVVGFAHGWEWIEDVLADGRKAYRRPPEACAINE